MEVFTEEWARACCERLNQRPAYKTEAADWEGAAVLIMSAHPASGVPKERAVLLDLHHGVCRGTRAATPDDVENAPYVLRAAPPAWKELLNGDTEVVAAIVKGALRLERGSLFTLARYTGAAREMLAAAAQAGGHFPRPTD
jgi:putative sterol carrier protein